ncbi:defensin-A3-like [Gracilinanus agilis]|uniref:defensin-A3-like n=1 Tax=Gracilinanus agilis TaxID=191870 RepID=UPI001CFEB980|nr:defensin-A3-like [Gracilinanus agilis]
MKTFFLLTVVIFLTIQVQAERKEEILTQEEAMAENESPKLPSMEAEDSDVMTSDPQQKRLLLCFCRKFCFFGEKKRGTCRINGVYYRFCCI